jgi:uncharacterized protein (TIGR02001 family)
MAPAGCKRDALIGTFASAVVRYPRQTLPLTGFVLAALACAPAPAQERPSRLDGYLTLASDYVRRGLSQTAGSGTVQAGLDYAHSSGFFAGGRVSNVDFDAEYAVASPRDVEIDAYVGFGREHGPWTWAVTAGAYLYPDSTYDYDYAEFSATAAYRRWIRYTASYLEDWPLAGESALDHELTGSVPLPWDVEIAASVGRIDSSGVSDLTYSYWNAGATKLWKRLSFDLRYYDTSYSDISYAGEAADRQWVLSLSIGLRP